MHRGAVHRARHRLQFLPGIGEVQGHSQTARDRDRPTEEVYWVRLTGSIDLDVRRAVGLETTRSAWDKYEVYLDRLAKYGPMLMPPEVKLCQLDPKDFQRRHR